MTSRRVFLAAAAISLAMAGPALAHARLVSANPTRDAVVDSPASIRLAFSERMVPAFSTFTLENARGVETPVRTSVSEDGRTLTGTPARRLTAGVYTVNWAIASGDGHRMTGSYRFTVR